ncbi:tail fiber assembly protein [Enterobacter cloacae complex sp. 2025EL-00064]|uniref:tail fiber assembly protein n=1 Tax=Enterobacter cloacae complex sp. 2025EL-00064 TaxID=3415635 RepID=UPI003C768BB2
MDKFLNPKIYKKESVEIDGEIFTGQYFQDDKGRDWYETLTGWAGAVAVDTAGIVCAYESDVSYMGMEEGRNIYEVEPANVPPDVLGNYTFVDGQFTDIRPDASELANKQKATLLHEASVTVSTLQDAVDLSMATEAEAALLLEWKKYRVLLNRIDPSLAPDIEWPSPPN